MPLLHKRDLARITEHAPTKHNKSLRDRTEAEIEAREEYQSIFSDYFFSNMMLHRTFFLNGAELEEMGVTARSSANDIRENF
jgi:hypothetical protein